MLKVLKDCWVEIACMILMSLCTLFITNIVTMRINIIVLAASIIILSINNSYLRNECKELNEIINTKLKILTNKIFQKEAQDGKPSGHQEGTDDTCCGKA